MKNIFLITAATIGLSATAQAQSPKTVFQYTQEIKNILQTAVEKGIAEKNDLPMPEGEHCYAFEAKINGLDRQVFYCADTKTSILSWGEKDKDVDPQERQQLLEAITNKYPQK